MNKIFIRDEFYTTKLGECINRRYKRDMYVFQVTNVYFKIFNKIYFEYNRSETDEAH